MTISTHEVREGRVPPGAAFVVMGRVLGPTPSLGIHGWVLRDAWGQLPLAEAPDLPSGTLVLFEGVWNGETLRGQYTAQNGPTRPLTREGDHHQSFLRHDALRLRHDARRALRAFFDARDYLEVETAAMVHSPGLDLHLDAFEVLGGQERRWLITSPEYQMKRLMAGGLPRIYQLARCFRRGEVGHRHEPEFTMCEWYQGFSDASAMMTETEQLVAFITEATLGSTVLPSGVDVATPWPRRTVQEVFEASTGEQLMDVLPDEERFFRLFVEKVEPSFGDAPFFLTDWPASMASLARLLPSDPAFADRFEAYVGGVELCNGFGELVDAAEQRARLERDHAARSQAGLPAYPIDEGFLGALEEGLPPSAGNAMGFDRLVMLLRGPDSIRDVVAIPSTRL